MIVDRRFRIAAGFVAVAAVSFSLFAGCGPPPAVSIPPAGRLQSRGIGMHRETVDVPEVGSVKYAVDIPESYDGETGVPLVLMLHYGYEGAAPEPYTGADMIEIFHPGSIELEAVTVAPDVVGGDWTSPKNEKAAVWLVQSAMQTWNIDPSRVVVMGYSMGGEGAWFLGSRHQDVFTAAVPIAAPVAGGAEWKIPVCVVHSDADDIVSYQAARQHAESVKAAGAKVEFITANGLSHYDTPRYFPHFLEAARWLKTQWGQD